jgi:rubrerythrin
MGKSQDNLAAAFAGESQANRKYLAFAKKADQDGLSGVARLFRAAAAAETIHAHAHLGVLGGVGETAENLKTAIAGEHEEFTEMYPQFIEDAQAEGDAQAERSCSLANQVEEIHHGLFTEALAKLDAGGSVADEAWYVCGICGNTVSSEAPESCPICGAKRSLFIAIQ